MVVLLLLYRVVDVAVAVGVAAAVVATWNGGCRLVAVESVDRMGGSKAVVVDTTSPPPCSVLVVAISPCTVVAGGPCGVVVVSTRCE